MAVRSHSPKNKCTPPACRMACSYALHSASRSVASPLGMWVFSGLISIWLKKCSCIKYRYDCGWSGTYVFVHECHHVFKRQFSLFYHGNQLLIRTQAMSRRQAQYKGRVSVGPKALISSAMYPAAHAGFRSLLQ